jgi:hypothetical protein
VTPELLAFIDAYAAGMPLVDAYVMAHPAAAALPVSEQLDLALEARESGDGQEYLAFLQQEGRTVGAIPLRDHLADNAALDEAGRDLLERMMKRGGCSDSSAAAVFSQRVRLHELRGKASGHYAQRTEFGVAQGGGSGKFSVEWAE